MLNRDGFTTKKISLIKSSTVYDAIIMGKKETLSNGRWVVHAFGSNTAMERYIESIPPQNMKKYEANTLFINAPAVGRSKGYPTRYQMGGGFEAGLQFLEQKVKASHIVPKDLCTFG